MSSVSHTSLRGNFVPMHLPKVADCQEIWASVLVQDVAGDHLFLYSPPLLSGCKNAVQFGLAHLGWALTPLCKEIPESSASHTHTRSLIFHVSYSSVTLFFLCLEDVLWGQMAFLIFFLFYSSHVLAMTQRDSWAQWPVLIRNHTMFHGWNRETQIHCIKQITQMLYNENDRFNIWSTPFQIIYICISAL